MTHAVAQPLIELTIGNHKRFAARKIGRSGFHAFAVDTMTSLAVQVIDFLAVKDIGCVSAAADRKYDHCRHRQTVAHCSFLHTHIHFR